MEKRLTWRVWGCQEKTCPPANKALDSAVGSCYKGFMTIRERLELFGYPSARRLGVALGVTRQRAQQILRGDRFGMLTAQRIARILPEHIHWEHVIKWQDGKDSE